MEELVRNGAEKILHFSAAISADSVHSRYDVRTLVHKARGAAAFPLANMSAWNNHPLAIQAIRERIEALQE